MTASGTDRDPVTRESAPTSAVSKGAFTVTKPAKLTGTPKVGKVLTAKPGVVAPAAVVTYQWYVGTKKIPNATKAKLKLVKTFKGKTIAVKITYAADGYATKKVKLTSAKIK